MSYHLYAYDKNNKEITPSPSIGLSHEHEDIKPTTKEEALKFIELLWVKEECGELTNERKLTILETYWRSWDGLRGMSKKDRLALDLEWMRDIVSREDFGHLECC